MMFAYGASWAPWQVTLMWAGMLAFWVLVIWAGYRLFGRPSRRRGDGNRGPEARDLLDERLVRGEIDTKEYQRLRDLVASAASRAPVDAGNRRMTGTSNPA